IFMMPQLGVLAEVNREAALSVFKKDCLIPLGWCIAPVGADRSGRPCVRVARSRSDRREEVEVAFGEMAQLALADGERATVEVRPTRRFDVGGGRGVEVVREVTGGAAGVIIDARGRPLGLPEDADARENAIRSWWEALDVYPPL
ncbi:MAG: methylaspartate mutase, partial [Armatimonadota bacterium]